MRQFVILAALAVALSSPAWAANKQQDVMKSCNTQAAGKKGDERKTFMSACLKGEAPAAAAKPANQQERMKACNKDATGKKGDDRKAFMKSCLSNAPA